MSKSLGAGTWWRLTMSVPGRPCPWVTTCARRAKQNVACVCARPPDAEECGRARHPRPRATSPARRWRPLGVLRTHTAQQKNALLTHFLAR